MPSKTTLELLDGGGDLPDQTARIPLAIDLLRTRVVEEFQIAERLDAKGRQIFALSAAFFAVAQTVAFGAFRAAQLTGAERVGIALLAGVAAFALLLTGHRLADAEEPQSEQDIKPAVIEKWVQDKTDEEFGRLLVVHLRQVVEARHASNERRALRYGQIESIARVALIFTAAEILVSIAFRAA
jgi:hypothetical protein